MPLQVVYVLTNAAMPGLVKIGMTTLEDARSRIDQLYTTGVPFPFDIAFVCKVANAAEVERALHIAFEPSRLHSKREFFKIAPEQAIAILKLLHVEDASRELAASPTSVEPEDTAAAKNFRARRPNLNFLEMDIPVGSYLSFTNGDTNVQVASERKVKFGDEETSLTAVTRQLLGLSYSVSPGRYWTYNGRTIDEIYEDTYQNVDL